MPIFDVYSTVGATAAPLEVLNDGDQTIPPYSPCEITQAYDKNDRIVLKAKRVTRLGWRPRVAISLGAEIRPGKLGAVTLGAVVAAAFHSADGTPKQGEAWGPVADSFELRKHVAGGRVLKDAENGRCVLLRYDPADLWGKLTEDLETGNKATATLYRFDRDASLGSTNRLVAVSGITFEAHEATGEGDTIVSETLVFARWDEIADEYILRGWVC
jgi:hypothetical protein